MGHQVRKGSVGVTYSEGCSAEDRQLVSTMFSSVARCTEIPEKLQNAFAAMAGSGPAYIYQVIEALADGAVMMGLPRALATEQAAAMVVGAAGMVLVGDKHPALLKDEVQPRRVNHQGGSEAGARWCEGSVYGSSSGGS